MRPLAAQPNREGVRRGGEGPWFGDHLPDDESAVDVPAKDCLDTIEHSTRQNRGRARSNLFGGLQHDQDVTFRPSAKEVHRGANCPGGVHVMAARVHDPRCRRRERQSGLFIDGERVDVATDRHHRRVSVQSRNPRHDPGPRHTLNRGNAK